jgi:hypothetical protein
MLKTDTFHERFGVAANMHIFIWEVAGLSLACTPTVLKFCGFSRSTQTNVKKGIVIRPRLLPSTSCSSYNPQIFLPPITIYAEVQTASRKKDLFFYPTRLKGWPTLPIVNTLLSASFLCYCILGIAYANVLAQRCSCCQYRRESAELRLPDYMWRVMWQCRLQVLPVVI